MGIRSTRLTARTGSSAHHDGAGISPHLGATAGIGPWAVSAWPISPMAGYRLGDGGESSARGSDGKFKRRSDGKAQDNSSSSSSCCCGTNCGTCARASGSAYSYWTATVSGVTTCSGCYYLGSLWGTGSGDLDGTGNLPFSGGGSGVAEWYASSAYTSAYSVTFYNPTDCSGTGTLRSNLSVGIRFGVCIDANKTISVLAATSTGSLFYGTITPLPGDCSSISSLTFSNLITRLQRHRADLGAGHRIWWHGGFNPSRMISDVSFCHRCVLGNGYACSGGCPCPFDSREIVEHALSSYCPHPDGPRFGTGKKPGRWDELAAIDVSATHASASRFAASAGRWSWHAFGKAPRPPRLPKDRGRVPLPEQHRNPGVRVRRNAVQDGPMGRKMRRGEFRDSRRISAEH